jgi:hypothetical protein
MQSNGLFKTDCASGSTLHMCHTHILSPSTYGPDQGGAGRRRGYRRSSVAEPAALHHKLFLPPSCPILESKLWGEFSSPSCCGEKRTEEESIRRVLVINVSRCGLVVMCPGHVRACVCRVHESGVRIC